MLTARPFVVCLAALVPLASLAGCGDDERGLAVAPASSVGGARPGADTGKGPSVSSTADGPSVQPGPLNPRVGDASVVTTPFDAAFHAVTGVECTSSGIDSVSVQLPITQFQFSTCHVVLEKTSAVTGALTVDALGVTPSDPWTTAVEAVMGSPGRVDVSFAHARTGFDWYTSPLTLRFGFINQSGVATQSGLTLAAAPQSAIFKLQAPRIPTSRSAVVQVDGHAVREQRYLRRDSANVAVVRAGETLPFDVPFELAPGASAEYLAGNLIVTPDAPSDGDACLFDDLLRAHDPKVFGQARDAGWENGEGTFALSFVGGAARTPECATRIATQRRITGQVMFDPHMGLGAPSSAFALRVASATLDGDVKVKPSVAEGSLLGLEVRNVADYALEPLVLALRFVCAGDDPRPITTTIAPSAEYEGDLAVYRTLLPGSATKWTGDAVRTALRDALTRTGVTCSVPQWKLAGVAVQEQGRPGRTPLVDVGSPAVPE